MALLPGRDGLSPPYTRPQNRWQNLGRNGFVQQDNQPVFFPQQQLPYTSQIGPAQPGQVIYSNTPFAPSNDQFGTADNAPQVALAGPGLQDQINTGTMQYTGQAGRFLYAVDDGPNSDYLQCVYSPDRIGQPNIVELCEKVQDCCSEGCCPKDQFWMAGVYVLIAVVIVVAVVGFAIAIVCYFRSRSKSRRDQEYDRYGTGYAGSQAGYPYGPYGSSIGPPSAKY